MEELKIQIELRIIEFTKYLNDCRKEIKKINKSTVIYELQYKVDELKYYENKIEELKWVLEQIYKNNRLCKNNKLEG